jgi:hypothetical protein
MPFTARQAQIIRLVLREHLNEITVATTNGDAKRKPVWNLVGRTSTSASNPELSKKRNRLSSGCGSVVVAKHSSEALSALYGVMG